MLDYFLPGAMACHQCEVARQQGETPGSHPSNSARKIINILPKIFSFCFFELDKLQAFISHFTMSQK